MGLNLTDEQLKTKAWDLLGEHLGPVDAVRFLMLVREGPRDYQSWREDKFAGMSVAELARQIRSHDQSERGG